MKKIAISTFNSKVNNKEEDRMTKMKIKDIY